MKKQPSKEALDRAVKALIPYIVEMIKEDKKRPLNKEGL